MVWPGSTDVEPSASGTASIGAAAATPPGPSPGATQAELARVWLDALLVADGLFFGDPSLVALGMADYQLFTGGLPDVKSELDSQFYRDGFSDLAFFALNNP